MEDQAVHEVNLEQFKHLVSERALTGETMVLNMGPQHPATHGVLRLVLELDGERVINVIPDIGFLHTGIEKTIESKSYLKSLVLTDRLDYMHTLGNNLVYCLAIEKLAELDVPPRAQAIRVIMAELTRLSSHLLYLGSTGLDTGAMSIFLYCFREREMILDILESCSGHRMMTSYIRPGGIWRDVPPEFEDDLRAFIKEMHLRITQYEDLLTKNQIFLDRTVGIGILKREDAIRWGVTGPVLRASGVDYDLRKAQPYSGYEQYDFEVPTSSDGDVYARYTVRIDEMRQSLRIIEQALDKLPSGPVSSTNRKYVPPARSELGTSMEALIHHFKLWTEGFSPPKGSVYAAVEAPRGEMGVFMESDGGSKPYRCHYRTPSFAHIQIMPLMMKGYLIADLVVIIASIDIVLGDADR
ncbi:MAG: NADH-quinone oxidoreductase subunit D [Anaerolineaceae bacterium]|nr:NADH-quinone oxidoreductase subunit D [Anaerolineaceae bacterium]